jgi:hypothetical protein
MAYMPRPSSTATSPASSRRPGPRPRAGSSPSAAPQGDARHTPEFTYSRLLDAAELARKLGAQIMGLGAFTKVVGDAGVTVAKQAPLPVTTGNSYSASGALWAAHDALRKLGIAAVDDDGRSSTARPWSSARPARSARCAPACSPSPPTSCGSSPRDGQAARAQEGHRAREPAREVHVATNPRATRCPRWTSSSPRRRRPATRCSTS